MKRRRESEDSSSDTLTPGEINQHSSATTSSSSPNSPKTTSPDSLSIPADNANGKTENMSAKAQQPALKIVELDSENSTDTMAMTCCLPPHEPLVFSTYGEYESHYYSTHTNRCHECGKNFPSDHMLNLHIEETHDSFVAVKRERGEKTFSCFVEGCDRKCSTAAKRNMHLVDKHMFPRDYFFNVTLQGIDGRTSMLQDGRRRDHPRRSLSSTPDTDTSTEGPIADEVIEKIETAPAEASTAQVDSIELDTMAVETADQKEVQQEPVDEEMEDLAGAMSALKFIPRSVRFGRGGKKGFSRT